MALDRNPGPLLRRIIGEAAVTLIAEAAVVAAFFVFYRLLIELYGTENLGVYTLMRRYAAMLLPLLMLGLSDGLGRFIAVSAIPAARTRLALAGALGVLSTSSIAWVWLNADASASAAWLFGDARFHGAVMPFSVLLVGLSMHLFVHACLRGHLRMLTLNAMQLVNLGLVPIAALVLFPHASFSEIVRMIGIATFSVALLFLTFLIGRRAGTADPAPGPRIGAMYAFSISRIPGAMLGAGLASLAPIIAKDYIAMTEVGYLSLSLGVLLALGAAMSPIGTVLLPHISALAARNDARAVGERLHLLIGAAIQLYVWATFQLLALSEFLVELWMGSAFLPALAVFNIVLVSLPFFGFYCATRSVLDAVSVRPINSINTVLCIAVLLGTIFAALRWRPSGNLPEMFAVACALATVLLGVLSYVALRAIFPRDRRQDARHALWAVTLGGAFFLLSTILRPMVTASLPVLVLYELCILGLYLAALRWLQFHWLRMVFAKVLP